MGGEGNVEMATNCSKLEGVALIKKERLGLRFTRRRRGYES